MSTDILLQMGMAEAFSSALFTMLQPTNFAIVLLAVLLGMIMGIIPGMGGTVTLALLIPVTYGMEPITAFMLLAASTGGVSQAASITSILINTPGRGGNAATVIDGYPMARQGRAGEAIGASTTASALGAFFGIAIIFVTIPVLLEVLLLFRPPDVFWIAVWGITTVAVIVRGSAITGLIGAVFGVLFGLHGLNRMTATPRWDYGLTFLQDGLPLIPAIIGLFAVAEMMRLVADGGTISEGGVADLGGGRWEGAKQVFRHPALFMRASIIGAIIGIIPGVGSTAANYIAYFQAIETADDPESFGTGDIRGVIAPEASNDAKEGTALIPTLGLGIPGSAGMAVLLGAFVLHGIQPGPRLFTNHLPIVAIIILSLLFSNFLSSILGLLSANQLVKLTSVDVRYLAVGVIGISFFGTYTVNNNIFQVFIPVLFGVLGYAMIRVGMSRVPMIIGFVLAQPIEENFFRSLQLSRGDYGVFVESYLSLLLIGLLGITLFLPYVRAAVARIGGGLRG